MGRRFQRTILAALGMVILPAAASAQEWTRFRGPNGTGESETVLPATWTDDDYAWRIELPGTANSSPVLWGNKLFVMSADREKATRYVLCYDSETGKKLWSREFASTPHHIHTMSSFASCTPAVDADRVYVAWSTPASITFMALTHTGETAWTKDLGTWMSQHGFGTSPMIFEDLVILSNSQEAKDGPKMAAEPPKSYIMGFDRQTGEERWRTLRKTDNVSYSCPAIFQPKDGPPQLVNTSTGSGLYALDPHTGEELWSSVVFDKRTVSSPVVKGDLIFGSTGSGGGGNYVAAVRSDGKKGEMAYKIDTQAPYVPSVVGRDDMMFLLGDAGIVSCIDIQTGDVHWRKRIGGTYSGSPVRAGDKLYCVSADGEVVVLAASKEFEELGRVKLGEGSRSSPAVANGKIFFRTYSHLMAVDGKPKK
ncbi:MAG: PQQ-binding-like beta-propeller repeat protein [Planctomycetaceae bacterium]|nr:PQQ-binding-like beta-propeller repeat protein [Planctomycetaceae bacterium]